MPNNYFKFKQFTVQQENCAMKVCTDACLFGAWVADQVKTKASNNILDIGTGTGLLSLMLAQRVPGLITAVEIDEAAYIQAKINFEHSLWNERLIIFNSDIIQFNNGTKYDCIISNPPFFENDLRSVDENKNAAKHGTTLSLEQLFLTVRNLLNEEGNFAVLLPYHRVEECILLAKKNGLHLNRKVLVKQTQGHTYFRGMLVFNRHPSSPAQEEINIKKENEKYSERFAELLKDYYLYL